MVFHMIRHMSNFSSGCGGLIHIFYSLQIFKECLAFSKQLFKLLELQLNCHSLCFCGSSPKLAGVNPSPAFSVTSL